MDFDWDQHLTFVGHGFLETNISTKNPKTVSGSYSLPEMLMILKQVLKSYDDLIAERLRRTDIYLSEARKGLGLHFRRDDEKDRYCRGRKVYKRGYRNKLRKISTVFGDLTMEIREMEYCKCGVRYSPLLSALKIGRYAHKEVNFEHEVIESVINTNYRRLIDGRSISL